MTEEVRKCVEILRYCEESGARCGGCPSGETNGIPNCHSQSHIADLIESLSAQLDQVTRERDAAVEDAHGVCKACIHYNGHYPPGEIMSCCKFEECVHGSDDWDSEDHWQWRGVEVEG